MARVIDQVLGATTSSVVGEITRELVNASDGQGLHLEDGGKIDLGNVAAAKFGTSDFSVEFVLNQTGENSIDNYIYFSNASGNNRVYFRNDLSENLFRITFADSGGTQTAKDIAYDMSADYNTPTHYVVTFDRDGDATLYKNGNSVGSVDISAFSSINLGDGNANVQQISSGANYGVLGTFYRFRTFNKLVDAKALYERADVDFADQYGSQTDYHTHSNAVSDHSTEANATTGWAANNSPITSQTTVKNVGSYAFKIDYNAGTNAPRASYAFSGKSTGKKYRLQFDYKHSGTGDSVVAGFGYDTYGGVNIVHTITASETSWTTKVYEFEDDGTNYAKFALRIASTSASATTIYIDNFFLVQIGCVSDYDLAFANPTQSRTVQDRSGTADGTASTSGVTQVQPVVQGNLTSLAVSSATARTPADGAITCEDVLVNTDSHFTTGGTPKVSINTTANALTFGFSDEIAYIRKQSGAVFQWQTSDSGSNAGEIQLQPYGGSVVIGANNALTIDSSGQITQTGEGVSYTIKNSDTSLGADQLIGGVAFEKTDGSGAGAGVVGGMRMHSEGSVGESSYLAFSTADSSTNDVERVRITSDGSVGIGTPTPTVGNLQIRDDSVSILALTRTTASTSSDIGMVRFGNTNVDSNLANIVAYHDGANDSAKLVFQTQATGGSTADRLTIASTGLATFSNGIAFSQTNSSATGATATGTTLDHYEEGTFTATLNGSTGEPATLVTATANYTRVGDRVFFSIGFENAATTGYSGDITISGLPFANAGVVRAPISVITYDSATWTTGSQAAAFVGRNHSYVSMYAFSSGGVWNALQHDAGTGRYFWLNGTYRTAAA